MDFTWENDIVKNAEKREKSFPNGQVFGVEKRPSRLVTSQWDGLYRKLIDTL